MLPSWASALVFSSSVKAAVDSSSSSFLSFRISASSLVLLNQATIPITAPTKAPIASVTQPIGPVRNPKTALNAPAAAVAIVCAAAYMVVVPVRTPTTIESADVAVVNNTRPAVKTAVLVALAACVIVFFANAVVNRSCVVITILVTASEFCNAPTVALITACIA